MFKCFKKKIQAGGYGEGMDKLLNWGLVIPHTKDRQGALSFDEEVSEYIYGHRLARILEGIIPSATRDTDGIRGAIIDLLSKDCNASIEPHFNAYNGNVSGAEVLCLKGDYRSAELGSLLLEDLKQRWPHRKIRRKNSNGIKWVAEGDRGYSNLALAKKLGMDIAILTELFFGDVAEDWLEPSDQAKLIKDLVQNT